MSSLPPALAVLTPEELSTLSNVSVIPPPKGITSNFTDPENQNLANVVVTSVLFGIMILAVLNRIYVKSFIIRKYSADDGQLPVSLFCVMIVKLTVIYYGSDSCSWSCEYKRISSFTRSLETLILRLGFYIAWLYYLLHLDCLGYVVMCTFDYYYTLTDPYGV